MQEDLFGLERGMELQSQGHASVTENNRDWFERAKREIRMLAQDRAVTSDDMYLVAPPPAGVHVNTVGAVMKAAGLHHTGVFRRSNRASAHGRRVGVWSYFKTGSAQ
jgi:hypothetical protein